MDKLQVLALESTREAGAAIGHYYQKTMTVSTSRTVSH